MVGFSIVGSLLKIAVVFALLFVTLKLVARLQHGGTSNKAVARAGDRHRPLEVLARSAVGRNASVVLVRVGSTCLALGVSEHSVRVLTKVELDSGHPAPTETPAEVPASSWRDALERLRERTVRRSAGSA